MVFMKQKTSFTSSLSDQLAYIIKDKIINGELKPGEKVKVRDLAEEFQTSTTPVRDALNKVVSDGMATVSPRVGYFVKSFSDKDVDDIFFVRITLECAILESIFSKLTIDEIESWKEIDRKFANKDLSPEEMHEFSHEGSIHLLLCRKCDNQYLKDVYISFFEKVLLISSVVAHEYSHFTDHSDILDALATKDLERAKQALINHLESARLSIHEHLKKAKEKT